MKEILFILSIFFCLFLISCEQPVRKENIGEKIYYPASVNNESLNNAIDILKNIKRDASEQSITISGTVDDEGLRKFSEALRKAEKKAANLYLKLDLSKCSGISFLDVSYFNGRKGLGEIIIPECSDRISKRCFYGCTNLKKVIMNCPAVNIEPYAFFGCENLEEIVLPETVENICLGAFHNCSKIKEIIIPAKVKNIETCAFANCINLEKVVFEGGSLETLGGNAFMKDTKLSGEDKFICTSTENRIGNENKIKVLTMLTGNPFFGIGDFNFPLVLDQEFSESDGETTYTYSLQNYIIKGSETSKILKLTIKLPEVYRKNLYYDYVDFYLDWKAGEGAEIVIPDFDKGVMPIIASNCFDFNKTYKILFSDTNGPTIAPYDWYPAESILHVLSKVRDKSKDKIDSTTDAYPMLQEMAENNQLCYISLFHED